MDEHSTQLAECRVFTRYLIDKKPDTYVSSRYTAALEKAQQALAAQSGFDRLLLSLARTHPVVTRAVDVYTRFFAHASTVRRRLVMLLAIIESSAATATQLDRPDHTTLAGFVLGMTWRSLFLAMILLVAIVTLLPAQLLLGRRAKRQSES